MTGEKLVGKLRQEAEEYRKEKKRNTLSGIHKWVKWMGVLGFGCCIQSIEPVLNRIKTAYIPKSRDLKQSVSIF